MSIQQFNGEWIPREDRLLLRINTSNNEEFRFWLTRLMLKNLLQGTHQVSVKTLEKTHTPEVAQVVQAFQQQAARQRAMGCRCACANAGRSAGDGWWADALSDLSQVKCDNGNATGAFTSPNEKLVCKSFTCGKFNNTSRANWLKLSRSRDTTCNSNVPVPLM